MFLSGLFPPLRDARECFDERIVLLIFNKTILGATPNQNIKEHKVLNFKMR